MVHPHGPWPGGGAPPEGALSQHAALRCGGREPHPRLRQLLLRARTGNLIWPGESQAFHYTYRARGALYQLFRGLASDGPTEVLLPAFHCPTVVEPILHAGHRVVFYDLTEDLGIDLQSVEAGLGPRTVAVLVINYFGFDTDLEGLRALLAARRVALVEDCSHGFLKIAPLRLSGGRGDASIYSFWKTVPSLVGGAYRMDSQKFSGSPDDGRMPLVTRLRDWKGLIDAYAEATPWHALSRVYRCLDRWRASWHRPAKATGADGSTSPAGVGANYAYDARMATAGCPAFARRILRCADLERIAAVRRRNFLIYARELRDWPGCGPLSRILPEDTCPWGFPLIVAQRRRHEHRLEAAGLPVFTFGETPHALLRATQRAYPVSRRLSMEVLMLPVHQDLEATCVDRFCRTVNDYFAAIARRQARDNEKEAQLGCGRTFRP